MLQNKAIKIVIKTTIGLALFLWMAYSLFNQIKHQPHIKNTVHDLFANWNQTRIFYLTTAIILMFLNWSLESLKWKMLLVGTERISFFRSLQSVLTGVAVSLITPNRIGEYMGRILYLRNIHKLQGVTVTIVGSFAQLIVTGFFGMCGLALYLFFNLNPEHSFWLMIFLFVSLLLFAVITWFYFHLDKIVDGVAKISFLQKIISYAEIVRRFDQKQLMRILLMSAFRYLVYAFQFLILLKLCLVEANNFSLLFTICLIFWAMAIVPTIAIAEIGIRGETALFFLLPLSANQFGIISSTVLLWLINLIIPALLGCLFVYKIKIYEDE